MTSGVCQPVARKPSYSEALVSLGEPSAVLRHIFFKLLCSLDVSRVFPLSWPHCHVYQCFSLICLGTDPAVAVQRRCTRWPWPDCPRVGLGTLSVCLCFVCEYSPKLLVSSVLPSPCVVSCSWISFQAKPPGRVLLNCQAASLSTTVPHSSLSSTWRFDKLTCVFQVMHHAN